METYHSDVLIVLFGTYRIRRRDVLMGRQGHVPLRRLGDVSFETCLRRRGDVLIRRRCYVLLRRRHDVSIRCCGDVPLRRLRDFPQRRR